MSLDRLLKRSITKQLLTISDQIIHIFAEKNILDLIGIQLDYKDSRVKQTLIRLLCGIVWFSDNIMIDDDDKVYLTDNIPNDSHFFSNPTKKQINLIRLKLSKTFINTASILYSLLPAKKTT